MDKAFEGDERVRHLAARVVGMSEGAAEQLVLQQGCRFRVVSRDGIEPGLSMDARGDRVNVHLDDGVVTRSRVG